MREFASVWKWTVEERKGIFTPSPERGTLKLNERPPPIPVKQHLLLIKVCVCVQLCLHMYTYVYIHVLYIQLSLLVQFVLYKLCNYDVIVC